MRKLAIATGLLCIAAASAHASPLTFSDAVATYSQGGFSPLDTITGVVDPSKGWAIDGQEGTTQTAVYTLSTPLAAGSHTFRFTMVYNWFDAQHEIGDFKLAFVTGTPSLASSQTALSIISATALSGATFTQPAPGQLLLRPGEAAPNDTYSVIASMTSADAITGFALVAIADPSTWLPLGGPGTHFNGNFVLNQFCVDADSSCPMGESVPPIAAVAEPSTIALFATGLLALGVGRRWRRTSETRSLNLVAAAA